MVRLHLLFTLYSNIRCRIGDAYAAARDYLYVIQNWSNREAYIGLIHALNSMKWKEDAQKWLNHLEKLKPETDKYVIKGLQEQIEISQEPIGISEGLEPLNDFDVSEDEKRLRADSFDYELRFLGHCNTTTDIKEANFLGKIRLVVWCL